MKLSPHQQLAYSFIRSEISAGRPFPRSTLILQHINSQCAEGAPRYHKIMDLLYALVTKGLVIHLGLALDFDTGRATNQWVLAPNHELDAAERVPEAEPLSDSERARFDMLGTGSRVTKGGPTIDGVINSAGSSDALASSDYKSDRDGSGLMRLIRGPQPGLVEGEEPEHQNHAAAA